MLNRRPIELRNQTKWQDYGCHDRMAQPFGQRLISRSSAVLESQASASASLDVASATNLLSQLNDTRDDGSASALASVAPGVNAVYNGHSFMGCVPAIVTVALMLA